MAAPGETSIAQLLDAAQSNPASAPELLSQVYAQLRALAQSYLRAERREHTLQATAVVHEAYIRLVGSGHVKWDSPIQFFTAAAEAMRRVLIDHARARGRIKRGGGRKRVELMDIPASPLQDADSLLALDEAIQRLAAREPAMAEVVRLRFFVGLEIEETARVLGVSAPTVKRRWQWARTWLYREISHEGSAHDRR